MMTTRRMFLGASAAALTTLAACSSQSGKGAGGLTLWTHNSSGSSSLCSNDDRLRNKMPNTTPIKICLLYTSPSPRD